MKLSDYPSKCDKVETIGNDSNKSNYIPEDSQCLLPPSLKPFVFPYVI